MLFTASMWPQPETCWLRWLLWKRRQGSRCSPVRQIYMVTPVESSKKTAVPDPHNDYAVSKLAMEYMANIWRDRLPITIVRPFNYTGRGQATSFLIPKLVQHFREKLPLIELGNIDVVREFGDVRDVAAFYVRLAEVKAPWGPFNICSGIGYSLNDVLEMLQTMTGIHPKISN